MGCNITRSNTGLVGCYEVAGYPKKLVLVSDDQEFADFATAATQDEWDTLLNETKATRAYPFGVAYNIESLTEDDTRSSGTTGVTSFVKEGKPTYRMTLADNVGWTDHKNLRSHNGQDNISIYIITENNFIFGYSPDGSKMKGFPLEEFRVESRPFSTGEETSKTMIYMQMTNARFVNDLNVLVQPEDWNPSEDIEGIVNYDLTLQSGGIGGSTATVDVRSEQKVADNLTGAAATGLVAADFVVKDDTGADVTIDTVNEDTTVDGRYTITLSSDTFADSYIINLAQQPAMTTKYIESTGAITLSSS